MITSDIPKVMMPLIDACKASVDKFRYEKYRGLMIVASVSSNTKETM
jgi:hypothetical protein